MASSAQPAIDPLPFSEPRCVKTPRLVRDLNELTAWHASKCEPYRNILRAVHGRETGFESLEELPMLPVRLFKTLELKSVPGEQVMTTMTSSGTTGQVPSRIYLDRATAQAQTRALAQILKSILGPSRLPMAIVDSAAVLKQRQSFSARGAGLLGFSRFGRDHVYLLDEHMQLDVAGAQRFLEQHRGATVLLFGFTSIVWRNFCLAAAERGVELDFGDSILIHGGGWKKLSDQQVDAGTFKRTLRERLGIRRVHNYYGMVEQTGSIFLECEEGVFHASGYSDVIVRDPRTLRVPANGVTGILELMSILPRSYPGHVLLSEDLATILGEDDCGCGRQGKYFVIHGRLGRAELRGCSDTQPA